MANYPPEAIQASKRKAAQDEGILQSLWKEIYLRNRTRIGEALQSGNKDRAKLEEEFATIPFEDMLRKAQEEAA